MLNEKFGQDFKNVYALFKTCIIFDIINSVIFTNREFFTSYLQCFKINHYNKPK